MMQKRAFRLYQRKRVVNINLNILLAGVITIAIAKYPVELIGNWVGSERTVLLWAIAYVLDMVIDVAVYYALHWLANHWNPRGDLPRPEERAKGRRFLRDATRIQAERAALVPLFMLVSLGLMWGLEKRTHVVHSWAFVWAFLAAMIVTRVVHTLWGYRSGTFRDAHPGDGGQEDAGTGSRV